MPVSERNLFAAPTILVLAVETDRETSVPCWTLVTSFTTRARLRTRASSRFRMSAPGLLSTPAMNRMLISSLLQKKFNTCSLVLRVADKNNSLTGNDKGDSDDKDGDTDNSGSSMEVDSSTTNSPNSEKSTALARRSGETPILSDHDFMMMLCDWGLLETREWTKSSFTNLARRRKEVRATIQVNETLIKIVKEVCPNRFPFNYTPRYHEQWPTIWLPYAGPASLRSYTVGNPHENGFCVLEISPGHYAPSKRVHSYILTRMGGRHRNYADAQDCHEVQLREVMCEHMVKKQGFGCVVPIGAETPPYSARPWIARRTTCSLPTLSKAKTACPFPMSFLFYLLFSLLLIRKKRRQ